MELLSAFGIDVRLLVANLINFLLLVGILYKLGYKPMLRFVRERQQKIADGLKHAEQAEHKLKETKEEERRVLAEAHREAQAILARAREQTTLQAAAMIKRAEEETKTIVARAKKEIRLEQELGVTRARQEVAGLVLAATEQVLRKKMDTKENEAFIKEVLKDV